MEARKTKHVFIIHCFEHLNDCFFSGIFLILIDHISHPSITTDWPQEVHLELLFLTPCSGIKGYALAES
jgi:hypothetical protein